MPRLLDTSVAIHLGDSNALVDRLGELGARPSLSAISRVELENGVYRDPQWAAIRRATLDAMLDQMETLDFDGEAIAAYRTIVSAVGYNRRKTLDRMIAATALAHDLTLITLNGGDFADIPGLDLEVWPTP
ncbi:MAG TPA: PIN domain-containing protein [Allosphingosinicella sp.]|nr:PIN domain-containing protein [Allosphingosinicella sp.]